MTNKRRTFRRRVLFSLLAVILPLILLAALVEGGTRIYFALSEFPPINGYEFRKLRPPPYADAAYFSPEFLQEQIRQPAGYHYQKEHGFLLPGDVHGRFYNVTNGRRLTTGQPDSFTNTVYLCGGSAIYCAEVPDEFTVPSLLQAQLTKEFVHRFRVENLAVPGATARQQLNRLKTVTLRSGDIVIGYHGANDLFLTIYSRNNVNQLVQTPDAERRLPIRVRILSYLYRKLRKHSMFVRLCLNPFDPRRPPAHMSDAVEVRRLTTVLREEYPRVLLETDAHVRAVGARFVHVLQPSLYTQKRLSDYEQALAANRFIVPAATKEVFDIGTPVLRDVCAQLPNQIETHDATAVFDGRAAGEEIFLDGCHVNHRGNERVTRFLFAAIFAAGPAAGASRALARPPAAP